MGYFANSRVVVLELPQNHDMPFGIRIAPPDTKGHIVILTFHLLGLSLIIKMILILI